MRIGGETRPCAAEVATLPLFCLPNASRGVGLADPSTRPVDNLLNGDLRGVLLSHKGGIAHWRPATGRTDLREDRRRFGEEGCPAQRGLRSTSTGVARRSRGVFFCFSLQLYTIS